MKNLFILLFSALILVSCNGGKKVVEVEPEQPNWVKSRPIDPNYYIGIGVASKGIHPLDYADQAKKHALNEMASEIKVKVAANSMLFSFEDGDSFKDEFRSFTKLTTNELIENFEQMGVWETSTEYRVYYRLSKAQYQKDKAARIEKATNESVSFVARGDQLAESGNYKNALLSFFQAVEPIKPYLGESLETNYDEKDIYLGNYIASRIVDLVSHFRLRASNSEIYTVWGQSISDQQLNFILINDEDKGIENIPLAYRYSHGLVRPKTAITNKEGRAVSSINKIKRTNSVQVFTVKVDFAQLFLDGKDSDEFTEKLLSKFKAPEVEVRINVASPAVYILSNEKSEGNNLTDSPLKNAATEALTKKEFRIVTQMKDADLIIEINANTKKSGTLNGLSTSLLSGFVSISDAKTKKEIYSQELKDIKGVKSTYKAASLNALSKGAERISSRIIPKFYRNYMK